MWSQFCEEANKVENKKIYNDDVERIVNDPERIKAINAFHEKRQAKRQNKLLTDAVVYAAISLAFGLCGGFHIMAVWIAFPVMAACGLYATFIFGSLVHEGVFPKSELTMLS